MARPKKRARRTFGRVDARSGGYRARYPNPEDPSELINLGVFDTMGDADHALMEVRSSIRSGTWKHPNRVTAETFEPYARAWIDNRLTSRGKPLSPRTRAEYHRYIDKGLAEFAHMHLSEIKPNTVRTWFRTRQKTGKTAAAREGQLLRSILQTAVEDEILTKNPAPKETAKGETGKKTRIPTEDELAIYLRVFQEQAPHLRLAVALAAYGGLRLSEWRALRRRDLTRTEQGYAVNVEWQAQYISGEGWEVTEPKSAAGVRVVPLPDFLTSEIDEHLNSHVGEFPNSLLFPPRGNGKFLTDKSFNYVWNRARKIAGTSYQENEQGERLPYEVHKGGAGKKNPRKNLPWIHEVTEHKLRAFAGTRLTQEAGANLREVMQFLGHDSVEASMRYQHDTGRLSSLVNKLEPVTQLPTIHRATGTTDA